MVGSPSLNVSVFLRLRSVLFTTTSTTVGAGNADRLTSGALGTKVRSSGIASRTYEFRSGGQLNTESGSESAIIIKVKEIVIARKSRKERTRIGGSLHSMN